MSGGSLEYLCYKIEHAIDEIHDFHYNDGRKLFQSKLNKQFLTHLRKIADALHDIEWVMDCDMGEGDEIAAIKKVLKIRPQPKSKRKSR